MRIILSHLCLVHSNDPHFLVSCGLNGCATASKSFLSARASEQGNVIGLVSVYRRVR